MHANSLARQKIYRLRPYPLSGLCSAFPNLVLLRTSYRKEATHFNHSHSQKNEAGIRRWSSLIKSILLHSDAFSVYLNGININANPVSEVRTLQDKRQNITGGNVSRDQLRWYAYQLHCCSIQVPLYIKPRTIWSLGGGGELVRSSMSSPSTGASVRRRMCSPPYRITASNVYNFKTFFFYLT